MTDQHKTPSPELEPCPFCGDAPEPVPQNGYTASMISESGYKVFVWCANCDGDGPERHTHAEAITAWNTRSPQVSPTASGEGCAAREPSPAAGVKLEAILGALASGEAIYDAFYFKVPRP